MANNYVVTAHKPTAVNACVTGKFMKNTSHLRNSLKPFSQNIEYFSGGRGISLIDKWGVLDLEVGSPKIRDKLKQVMVSHLHTA